MTKQKMTRIKLKIDSTFLALKKGTELIYRDAGYATENVWVSERYVIDHPEYFEEVTI